MGTTLDWPLYYINSKRMGLRFILVFITSTKPVKFLASFPGRSFVLILIIVQLDITMDFFFFRFILFCLYKCL